MAQIELWTWFGRQLSSRRGAEQLEGLLDRFPPGTAIEGDWLPTLGVFFAREIMFTGQVQRRQIGLQLEFHRPGKPENADIDILDYPPDDWRLELFLNSDQVVVIAQPDEATMAVDLRSYGYEHRVEILRDVVARIDHPDVRVLPAAETGFRRAYEKWKLHDFAEGVVIKHRQSQYPTEGNSLWKRHSVRMALTTMRNLGMISRRDLLKAVGVRQGSLPQRVRAGSEDDESETF